ncbi:hypothetical protein [Halobacterium salinarum]|uniref:hypothetical protein n=1 Tax=Halobacterium salinarum TaxID=2242 RepID=UPI0019655AC4|nr:hypothetical protein [Halobacterium salinarum]MDL0132596.1 hypothetical protein [Halobacterium salinarum]
MNTLSRNPDMNKPEIVRLLVLWFVVVVFLQTSPGSDGPITMGIGLFALASFWIIPLYVLTSCLSTVMGGLRAK